MAQGTSVLSRHSLFLLAFVVIGGILLAVTIGPAMLDPAIWPAEDWVVPWSAGQIYWQGGNPYSLEKLHALQQTQGSERPYALPFHNPPWTLSCLLPFTIFDFPASRCLWLLTGVVILTGCTTILLSFYEVPPSKRFVIWCLCFTFLPALLVLRMGQLTILSLLGVVGFLHFQKHKQWTWAGASLVLTTIKPHLLMVLLVAILFWSLREGRWRLMITGLLLGLGLTFLSWVGNPMIFQYFFEYLGNSPPTFLSPTLAAFLEFVVKEPDWIRYIPLLFGLIWVGIYYWRKRREWDWGRETPLLLLVSLLVSPYGSWSYDFVLLLIPVIQLFSVAAKNNNPSFFQIEMAIFVLINVVLWAMNIVWLSLEHYYVWVIPTALACYLIAQMYVVRSPKYQAT